MSKSSLVAVLAAAGLVLTGCGGGSGSSGNAPPSPPLSGTISGTVAKGPVSGGTITAYALSSGAVATEIAHATTDADGHFSLSMGGHAGPIMLQLVGGTYTDEATGTAMTMLPGDVMTAVVPGMTAGQVLSGIQVTPLTTMAQTLAQHRSGGMTDNNMAAANMAVGDYFSVTDILHDGPINPLVTGSGTSGATQDSINYGMTLAAIAQYADANGMSSSSTMVTAMSNDAADGFMDGSMSGHSVMMSGMGMPMPANAGTSGLATAMSAFIGSAQNHSGVALATMQPLIDRLNGSNGRIMNNGAGTVTSGQVSGTAFSGVLHAGTITAYAIANGVQGPRLAGTALDSSGHFFMSIGTYTGPVMLRVSAGMFSDEATGVTMKMGEDDVMTAVLPDMGGGAEVNGLRITPLTSMAQARSAAMSGGMTSANIAASNTAIGHYFLVDDILTIQPVDMSAPGAGTAGMVTQDQIDYGAAIAAMSQYAAGLGMSTSSAFFTAMMWDASDGKMDGMMNGTPIQMGAMTGGGMMGGSGNMMSRTAGASGLAEAMTDFMESTKNQSGLTPADVNALVQQLAGSNGVI